MKLYKNVDLCDLKSIMENGILSLDETDNNNWENNKRCKNPTNIVYLFSPKEGKENSYPKSYGMVLLEVDADDAMESKFADNDYHSQDYNEYVCKFVPADKITKIIIPKFLKKRVIELNNIAQVNLEDSRIIFCDMTATDYDDDKIYSENILTQFAKTASIYSSSYYNYFRGVTEKKNDMIDLYNINYIY